MRTLRFALCALALVALNACGARTILSDGSSRDGSVALDAVFPQPDVVFPQPDVVFPQPDVVFPQPDVVFPQPDVVFPQPDVVFPQPDVVFPQPDVIGLERRCEDAVAIAPGQGTTGTTAGWSFGAGPCLSGVAARTAWFAVTLPSAGMFQARVRVSSPGARIVVGIVSDCATGTCLGVATSGDPNGVITTTTRIDGPRRVLVGVAAVGGAEVPFGFETTFTSDPVASNSTCATASELQPPVALPATIDGMGEAPAQCPSGDVMPFGARWYRVRVPSGQTVVVNAAAQPRIMRGIVVRIAQRCGGACITANGSSTDGTNVSARWTNIGPGDETVWASVAPNSNFGAPQPVVVTATLFAPAMNATCARATTVVDGTNLPGQDLTLAGEVQPVCPGMGGQGGAALWYRALVPAGQTLFASARNGTTRVAPILRVTPGCGSGTCLAASTSTGTGSSVAFRNTTRTDQPVILSASTQDPRFAGTFDLGVSIRAPAANGTCAGARRVENGTTLIGESIADGRDLPTACAMAGRDGPALFYRVRVGAGEQLLINANRTDTTFPAPTLRLTDACGSLTCLAQSTQVGQASRLSYTNTTAAPQELVVSANLLDGGTSTTARVDLAFSIARPPYTVSAIPAACDADLPNVIAAATGDDVGTPSQPLPSPVRFFGTPVSHVSVSTNGYLQLWTAPGTSGGALGSLELPNPMAPRGIVAPLWDDLEVRAGQGEVRWQVFPSPPRLTVQWTNANFCCGPMNPDRLTFQAKIFATGVIEFHYCALVGSARTTGQNASIGMQDVDGLRGVSYAVRRAGAVMTGTGVRFTP